MKILLLSVGSLLGQGMLDVFEGRRVDFQLIGANSEAESVNNFRCDRTYLLPETASGEAYTTAFTKLIQREQPQLILPGRDADVVFLARYREAHPAWQQAIPCGSAHVAETIADKHHCFLWAQARSLPFAKSFLYHPGDEAALQHFVNHVNFPLVAKPRHGFGSRGVLFVENLEDVVRLGESGSVFLQEYLGDPASLNPYFERYRQGMPLFFQVPETRQFAAQGLIDPQGQIGDVFCSLSTMVMGRTERFEEVHIPELRTLFLRYARALRDAGWQGMVNVQAKPSHATGLWKAFELGLRMSGGTSSRLLLGFDEMHHLMTAFYANVNFPQRLPIEADVIYPGFYNRGLNQAQVQQLKKAKYIECPS